MFSTLKYETYVTDVTVPNYQLTKLEKGFLKLHWSKWRRVLFTRLVAISPTILVAWYAVHSMHSLNTWLNVLQSVQLPFALIPVLQFTNSRRIMGDFANSPLVGIGGTRGELKRLGKCVELSVWQETGQLLGKV